MKARFVLLMAAIALASCSREPDAPPAAAIQASTGAPAGDVPAPAGTPAWDELASRFIEEYFKAQPFFAVQQGRHEFDGQMPDWSREGIEAEIERLRKWRSDVESFNAGTLSPQQSFERDYLVGVIDMDLFWLDGARFPFTNPAWYIGTIDPSVYLSREYAPLEQRMKAYIGYAQALPKIAGHIRANMRTPLPKSYVERAIAGFGGYAEFFRTDVPKVFGPVQNAELKKQFSQANGAAAKAMDELKKWFEAQRKEATDQFALGEQLFASMLTQTERVDMPLADLAAAGRADLERNLAALREACGRFAPQASLQDCVNRAEANKPEKGAVAGAQAQLANLKEFLVEKEVVSIPGKEEAQVRESPPYNRANFAYIIIPGPYEKGLPSTYYVTPPDPSWSAADRAAYIPGEANLLFTSVHEVWPGHFLQFLHSNRNSSKVASLWVGYAFAEGWAHYTEEMMWEMGLGENDPETHIGQLTNALLRNVRFLSAIGLHAQGMTLAQSEQMFRESAFEDPGTARQQAARGTYDPAYLNYTLGKLMIRKLRDDWIAKQYGSDGTSEPQKHWREFHDQFLSYGGPPIPLVRKAMGVEGGTLL